MSTSQRSSYGVLILVFAFGASTALAQAQRPSGPVQQRIAPGLATLTDEVLFGDVWIRPDLSPRDRSLVTISVLIATGKPAQLEGHLGRALNNGVLPTEASGVLAHLAIYSGWPSAVSALEVYDRVYTARKVDTSSLAAAVSACGCSCVGRRACARCQRTVCDARAKVRATHQRRRLWTVVAARRSHRARPQPRHHRRPGRNG